MIEAVKKINKQSVYICLYIYFSDLNLTASSSNVSWENHSCKNDFSIQIYSYGTKKSIINAPAPKSKDMAVV